MRSVVDVISENYSTLPKKLQAAAKYAIDNPERLAFGSMRSVAAECGVSTPTMLRLARRFGHQSYEGFKETFQVAVAKGSFSSRAQALQDPGEQSPEDESLKARIERAALRNIDSAVNQNDETTLRSMGRVLREADMIHIVAAGSMYWLATHMEVTGSIALRGLKAARPGSATLVETIASITPNDALLAIAVAPYAVSTVDAVKHAKRCGATVMVITDRRSSPLAPHADYCLFASTDSPHYYPSVVGSALLAEMILAFAVADGRDSEEALRRINKLEEIRLNTGAYI